MKKAFLSTLILFACVGAVGGSAASDPTAALAAAVATVNPQSAVVVPTITNTTPVAADPNADFLSQVLKAIQGFGGLSTLVKVTTLIMLLVSSMKVTFLNQLVWKKLGPYQSVVGAGLGVLAGVVGLFGHGAPVTLASVLAYLGAGIGATGLHELLDDIKSIPGIGPGYVAVINLIQSALGGQPPSQA